MSLPQTVAELNGTNGSLQTTTVTISIIIPALNEERMIGRCLESLTKAGFCARSI